MQFSETFYVYKCVFLTIFSSKDVISDYFQFKIVIFWLFSEKYKFSNGFQIEKCSFQTIFMFQNMIFS